MPSENLAEELRKLRKSYHRSTFSLDTFVRDSLEGIGGKRSQILWALGQISRIASKNENAYPDSEDAEYSELKDAVSEFGGAGKLRAIIEKALAQYLEIGEPHTRMLLEMSVTYACALFDGLVSDVLITVFRHVPEALRSGRTLTAEEVLSFSSREDLIEELARREALELAYKSADGQFSYFRKAFNIDVFGLQSLDVTIADLAAVHERRNLIVHNNGLATASYVAKYCPGGSIGDPIIVNAESAKSDREILKEVGMALIYSFHTKLAP